MYFKLHNTKRMCFSALSLTAFVLVAAGCGSESSGSDSVSSPAIDTSESTETTEKTRATLPTPTKPAVVQETGVESGDMVETDMPSSDSLPSSDEESENVVTGGETEEAIDTDTETDTTTVPVPTTVAPVTTVPPVVTPTTVAPITTTTVLPEDKPNDYERQPSVQTSKVEPSGAVQKTFPNDWTPLVLEAGDIPITTNNTIIDLYVGAQIVYPIFPNTDLNLLTPVTINRIELNNQLSLSRISWCTTQPNMPRIPVGTKITHIGFIYHNELLNPGGNSPRLRGALELPHYEKKDGPNRLVLKVAEEGSCE